jgi:hypothetical protein
MTLGTDDAGWLMVADGSATCIRGTATKLCWMGHHALTHGPDHVASSLYRRRHESRFHRHGPPIRGGRQRGKRLSVGHFGFTDASELLKLLEQVLDCIATISALAAAVLVRRRRAGRHRDPEADPVEPSAVEGRTVSRNARGEVPVDSTKAEE